MPTATFVTVPSLQKLQARHPQCSITSTGWEACLKHTCWTGWLFATTVLMHPT